MRNKLILLGGAVMMVVAGISIVLLHPRTPTLPGLSAYRHRLEVANVPIEKVSVLTASPLARIEVTLGDYEAHGAMAPIFTDFVFSTIRETARAKAAGFRVDEIAVVYRGSPGGKPFRVTTGVRSWQGPDYQDSAGFFEADHYIRQVLGDLARGYPLSELTLNLETAPNASRTVSWTVRADGQRDLQRAADGLINRLSKVLDDLNTQGAMITRFTLRMERPGMSDFKWQKNLKTGQVTATS